MVSFLLLVLGPWALSFKQHFGVLPSSAAMLGASWVSYCKEDVRQNWRLYSLSSTIDFKEVTNTSLHECPFLNPAWDSGSLLLPHLFLSQTRIPSVFIWLLSLPSAISEQFYTETFLDFDSQSVTMIFITSVCYRGLVSCIIIWLVGCLAEWLVGWLVHFIPSDCSFFKVFFASLVPTHQWCFPT